MPWPLSESALSSALARLLPPAVTVALLTLLVRQLPPSELRSLLSDSSPLWLLVGGALYIAVNLLRSVRFAMLLGSDTVTVRGFLPVSFAVSLLNNVLPMRGGELSFVLLSRARFGIAASRGTAVLGLARLFDYIAVASLFVPLALLSLDRLPVCTDWPVENVPTLWIVAGAAAFVFAGALVALSLAGLGERLLGAVDRAARAFFPNAGGRIVDRAIAFGDQAVGALGDLKTRPIYVGAFGLSLVIWIVTFTWLYSFTRGVGRDVGFDLFVVGATFAVLSKALPLPTLGGLGVAEAGWALGFTLIGWSASDAIASGLAVTLLTLLVSGVFGLGSLLKLGLPRATRPARQT